MRRKIRERSNQPTPFKLENLNQLYTESLKEFSTLDFDDASLSASFEKLIKLEKNIAALFKKESSTGGYSIPCAMMLIQLLILRAEIKDIIILLKTHKKSEKDDMPPGQLYLLSYAIYVNSGITLPYTSDSHFCPEFEQIFFNSVIRLIASANESLGPNQTHQLNHWIQHILEFSKQTSHIHIQLDLFFQLRLFQYTLTKEEEEIKQSSILKYKRMAMDYQNNPDSPKTDQEKIILAHLNLNPMLSPASGNKGLNLVFLSKLLENAKLYENIKSCHYAYQAMFYTDFTGTYRKLKDAKKRLKQLGSTVSWSQTYLDGVKSAILQMDKQLISNDFFKKFNDLALKKFSIDVQKLTCINEFEKKYQEIVVKCMNKDKKMEALVEIIPLFRSLMQSVEKIPNNYILSYKDCPEYNTIILEIQILGVHFLNELYETSLEIQKPISEQIALVEKRNSYLTNLHKNLSNFPAFSGKLDFPLFLFETFCDFFEIHKTSLTKKSDVIHSEFPLAQILFKLMTVLISKCPDSGLKMQIYNSYFEFTFQFQIEPNYPLIPEMMVEFIKIYQSNISEDTTLLQKLNGLISQQEVTICRALFTKYSSIKVDINFDATLQSSGLDFFYAPIKLLDVNFQRLNSITLNKVKQAWETDLMIEYEALFLYFLEYHYELFTDIIQEKDKNEILIQENQHFFKKMEALYKTMGSIFSKPVKKTISELFLKQKKLGLTDKKPAPDAIPKPSKSSVKKPKKLAKATKTTDLDFRETLQTLICVRPVPLIEIFDVLDQAFHKLDFLSYALLVHLCLPQFNAIADALNKIIIILQGSTEKNHVHKLFVHQNQLQTFFADDSPLKNQMKCFHNLHAKYRESYENKKDRYFGTDLLGIIDIANGLSAKAIYFTELSARLHDLYQENSEATDIKEGAKKLGLELCEQQKITNPSNRTIYSFGFAEINRLTQLRKESGKGKSTIATMGTLFQTAKTSMQFFKSKKIQPPLIIPIASKSFILSIEAANCFAFLADKHCAPLALTGIHAISIILDSYHQTSSMRACKSTMQFMGDISPEKVKKAGFKSNPFMRNRFECKKDEHSPRMQIYISPPNSFEYFTTLDGLQIDSTGKFIDPTGYGLEDLYAGVIRCSPPKNKITKISDFFNIIEMKLLFGFDFDADLIKVLKCWSPSEQTSFKQFEMLYDDLHERFGDRFINLLEDYNLTQIVEDFLFPPEFDLLRRSV